MSQPVFLPTNRDEMNALGWDELDVLLVTGDAYVDSHSFGASLLGRWLLAHGYRTGIVSQPAWETTDDIARMGRPRLFAGVSAGALDSLLAHYTAFRKKRSQDAYSPGGKAGLRPNRAVLVYTGLVRRAFPGLPVAAGGIEASLRRASHYDFWSDALRHSIVLDSKADAVLYGMGEKSILAFAELFSNPDARQRPNEALARARLAGTAYAVHPDKIPAGAEELPSHEAIMADPGLLIKATQTFERQMLQGRPCLVQRSGGRAVVFEPPTAPLTVDEMDAVYGLPFTGRAHPSYDEPVPAVAMLEGSTVSHRGCGGGCSFCSLAIHQGRIVQSRSEKSIISEVESLASRPDWKGSITDIGGPSSNMWRAECAGDRAACKRTSCLSPKRCRHFKVDQVAQVALLRLVAGIDGVNHVRVASGVRHDLALESDAYMEALVGEFTGGQLKIAPEHISEKVLRQMRKSPIRTWLNFISAFDNLSRNAGKEQYLVPYLMSAFPGCTDQDMEELSAWLRRRGWRPQQVQCFIPTPGTLATAMFFAEQDADGRPIPVARTDAERLRQHRILVPDAEPTPVAAPRPLRGGQTGSGRGMARERRTGSGSGSFGKGLKRQFRSRNDAGGSGRGSGRPFKPREGGFGTESNQERPSRPRTEAGGSGRNSGRQFRTRDGGSGFERNPERPFRPRNKAADSSTGSGRPFPPRDNASGRPSRPTGNPSGAGRASGYSPRSAGGASGSGKGSDRPNRSGGSARPGFKKPGGGYDRRGDGPPRRPGSRDKGPRGRGGPKR